MPRRRLSSRKNPLGQNLQLKLLGTAWSQLEPYFDGTSCNASSTPGRRAIDCQWELLEHEDLSLQLDASKALFNALRKIDRLADAVPPPDAPAPW